VVNPNQAEVARVVRLYRKTDRREFAAALDESRNQTLLTQAIVIAIVKQLQTQRPISAHFQHECERRGTPLELRDKQQRAERGQRWNGRAAEIIS
jgi:hypothetical protein